MSSIASMWDTAAEKWGGELRAEFLLDSIKAKDQFEYLENNRAAIEKAFGEPLEWQKPAGGTKHRICIRKSADLKQRAQWPGHFQWLRDRLTKLQSIMMPYLEKHG